MKIALCLSGQPRFLDEVISGLKTNLIDPNEIDLFVHTWWDETKVGSKNDTSIYYQEDIVGTVLPNVPALIESLSPIEHEIEKQIDFSPLSEKLRDDPTAKQFPICSGFYSVMKANMLRRKHEIELSFTYDRVISARIDLFYGSTISVSEVEDKSKDALVLASKWQDQRQGYAVGLGDYTMDNNFAISTSAIMDKYAMTFFHMEETNAIINPPFAENYLGYHCRTRENLQVVTHPFDIEIMQRIAKK